MSTSRSNLVRQHRRDRGWSQVELARRAGISRTAVSAIEQDRLVPSVRSAMALARALECTVEELFTGAGLGQEASWAWPAPSLPCRYWVAESAGRDWLYPVESTGIGAVPFDGVWESASGRLLSQSSPRRTLVVATCDPAVGLLAAEYARQTPFRMLPLTRSSRDALALLQEGKIHAAGVHLSPSDRPGGNASTVREVCPGGWLLRIGVWQEGIAFSPRLKVRSAHQAAGMRIQWVGRERGSGARECLDELLEGKVTPRRRATDHRGVALAIRCGWADAGVCLRLASEEAGLGFLDLRREAYDLCFSEGSASDPRLRALVEVARSRHYRRLLECLPGYDIRTTGDLVAC